MTIFSSYFNRRPLFTYGLRLSTKAYNFYHTLTSLHQSYFPILSYPNSYILNVCGGHDKKGTCKFRNSSSTTLAIVEDEVDQLLVLFCSPWPLLQPNFITSSYDNNTQTR
ncbi:hypothetical protein AAHE18_09G135300 [Arachis hypogaea]